MINEWIDYCLFVIVLSQNPIMTFTELTQQLSQGWKNLDQDGRQQYENKAEVGRQRYGAYVFTPSTHHLYSYYSVY